MKPLAEAIKSGQILGVVNMVGCNNPKVLYEKCIVDVADVLLQNNVLILSNGCASFPLMRLGYCAVSGKEKAGGRPAKVPGAGPSAGMACGRMY